MPLDSASTDALRLIEQKRIALEAVVQLARSIEKFEQSLSAVLFLSGSAMKIPRTVLKTFRSLETQFEDRPNTELEQAIKGLEHLLQHDLAQIMGITISEEQWKFSASRITEDNTFAQEVDEISHLLDSLRRRAQTTVYLRLLLRDRGVHTDPLLFSVSDEDIQVHITQLLAEEAICRSRIIEDVQIICGDIEQMLSSHELPGYVIKDLSETRHNLEANLRMLRAGKKIEDIPFSFETISVVNPMGESFDIELANPSSIPASEKPHRRSLFNSLLLWLTTSWRTSWSDIRSGKKRR